MIAAKKLAIAMTAAFGFSAVNANEPETAPAPENTDKIVVTATEVRIPEFLTKLNVDKISGADGAVIGVVFSTPEGLTEGRSCEDILNEAKKIEDGGAEGVKEEAESVAEMLSNKISLQDMLQSGRLHIDESVGSVDRETLATKVLFAMAQKMTEVHVSGVQTAAGLCKENVPKQQP